MGEPSSAIDAGRIVRTVGAAAIFVVAAASATPSRAQSAACGDLAARLASLSRRPASPADRWAAAIVEQKQAIASNRAAQGRCGGTSDPRCAAIVERGRQMAANLAVLERQHAQMGGSGSGNAGEKARIERQMAQLRCGEKPEASARPVTARFDGNRSRATLASERSAPRRAAADETPPGLEAPRRESRGFFSMLFGGNAAGDPEPAAAGSEAVVAPSTGRRMSSGNYRTLCVRTCDGYFFPISFDASQSRLKTDANVCRALCPAAETRLYYHSNPGQEAEDAVAADGTGDALTALPNAFRYRTEVVAGCTCGRPDPRLLPPGAGGLADRRGDDEIAAVLPMPRPRPPIDEDPETQAVRAAGLVVEPVGPPPAEATTADATAATGAASDTPPQVRIVGPKYFSDR